MYWEDEREKAREQAAGNADSNESEREKEKHGTPVWQDQRGSDSD